MINIKILLCLGLVFIAPEIFSQDEEEYFTVKRDSARGLKIYENIEENINQLWDDYSGPHKGAYKELKKPFKNYLKYQYTRIYFHSEYENYLKQILTELVSNNPELQKLKFRVYFSRSPIPNATTYMDGSIFINIGLLKIMESEAQLAMVIGHELGHWQERHSIRDFEELHDLVNTEEVQELLREAKKKGNSRVERILKLQKSLEFADSKHSRIHEAESDSISLAYLRNTGYDLNDAILGISNLKLVDSEYFNMNEILRQTFDFEDQPFNSKWIYKRESMGDRMKFTLSDEEKDSLKTHPDPEKRYELLKNQLLASEPKEGSKNIVSEELFRKMKRDFNYQSVDVLFNSSRISAAMYYILDQQSMGDTSYFLKETMYKCLDLVHEKLSDHTLGRYVDTKNPYFSPEYNKLTIFIDNLTIGDIDKIKKSYKLKHNIKL